MKSKTLFVTSLIVLIIVICLMFLNLWIFSGADWLIRTLGFICLFDLFVLGYSFVKMIQKTE